jgi:hypothetical protein
MDYLRNFKFLHSFADFILVHKKLQHCNSRKNLMLSIFNGEVLQTVSGPNYTENKPPNITFPSGMNTNVSN